MMLVDSSVWIDYFGNADTRQVQQLDKLLGREAIGVGDLVLVEVLQGARHERDADRLLAELTRRPLVMIGGEVIAIQAARNYRALRKRGITIRKTINTLIATRCIVDGHTLLYSDRDFDPFVEHLGLRSALD